MLLLLSNYRQLYWIRCINVSINHMWCSTLCKRLLLYLFWMWNRYNMGVRLFLIIQHITFKCIVDHVGEAPQIVWHCLLPVYFSDWSQFLLKDVFKQCSFLYIMIWTLFLCFYNGFNIHRPSSLCFWTLFKINIINQDDNHILNFILFFY
jgi:hypothetical protein